LVIGSWFKNSSFLRTPMQDYRKLEVWQKAHKTNN
jgi:hypothetical protein